MFFSLDKHVLKMNVRLKSLIVGLFIFLIYLSIFAPFSYYHLFRGSISVFYFITIIFSFWILFFYKKKVSELSIACSISLLILNIYLYYQSFIVSEVSVGYQYFLTTFMIISYWLMPDKVKVVIQDIFIKSFSILLVISLIEHIIFLFFSKGIVLGIVLRDDGQQFYHLLLSLVKTDNLIPRFQFLFDEPGKLGTLCAFLFYLTSDTEYRKQHIVFLIAGIISFSFAFYILMGLSLLFTFKVRFRYVTLIVLLFFCVYYFLQESIDKLIIERIINFEGRSTPTFDAAFDRMKKTIYIWWGYGLSATIPDGYGEGDTVGLMREVYQKGVIGVCLIFLQYWYVIFKYNGVNKKSLFFLIIFTISFYQRAHIYDMAYLVSFFPFPNVINKTK